MKFYVDVVGGNDANAGTKQDPLASLTQALLEANAHVDAANEIYLQEGVYKGGNYLIPKSDTQIIGLGNVLMDCSGYTYFMDGATNVQHTLFQNLKVSGFTSRVIGQTTGSVSTLEVTMTFLNCTVFQSGALKDTTYMAETRTSGFMVLHFVNSTFWGVRLKEEPVGSHSNTYFHWTNSAIVAFEETVDTNMYLFMAYCAATQANMRTRATCFSAIDFPIPVLSEDADKPDLRYDSTHEQFQKYVKHGANQEPIGNISRDIISWVPSEGDVSSLTSNEAHGAFTNDTQTYDPSWQDITISAGVNDALDFDEGGVELTATILAATYATGAALATAIETALNAAGVDTYTVTASVTSRIVIASDGTELNLLWSTGTNVATSIRADIGFDAVDSNNQTTYTADDPLVVGGLADATDVTLQDGQAFLNLNIVADAIFGACVSPVLDNIVPRTLERVYIGSISSGSSEVDSTPWQDIVITAASNDKIDFNEGAGELTATIAPATYTSGSELATAIQTAMNVVAVANIAVEYTEQHYLKLTSDGATFELPWLTGTNTATSAKISIGFDNTDLTGALEYQAQTPLSNGRTVQVRGNNVVFDAQAAPATTSLDWTTVEVDGLQKVSFTYRFIQFKVTLRVEP